MYLYWAMLDVENQQFKGTLITQQYNSQNHPRFKGTLITQQYNSQNHPNPEVKSCSILSEKYQNVIYT